LANEGRIIRIRKEEREATNQGEDTRRKEEGCWRRGWTRMSEKCKDKCGEGASKCIQPSLMKCTEWKRVPMLAHIRDP
jgi:hypothetical protein